MVGGAACFHYGIRGQLTGFMLPTALPQHVFATQQAMNLDVPMMTAPSEATDKSGKFKRVQWTIASAWMRGVADLLRAQGLDVTALFREAGLDIRELEHARSRMPVEKIDRLWMLAEQHSKQPFVALSRATADKPTSFDMLAYSMMSCQNLMQAIERLVQYCAVVSDAVDLRVVVIAEGCRIEVTPMEPPQPGRSSRLDYTIVTFLAFCRWVTGCDIVPLGVELAYPAPVDLKRHELAFSCTPRFNALGHALLLRKADLQLPLPTANAALSQLHDRVVQDYIRELHPTSIERQLATSLVRGIANGRVMRRDVASDLCMSDRHLATQAGRGRHVISSRAGCLAKTTHRKLSGRPRDSLDQHRIAARFRRREYVLQGMSALVSAVT